MIRFVVVAVLSAALAHGALAQLAVTSTQPGLNANNVARAAPIVVNFNRAVSPATFTPVAFHAFARNLGPVAGTLSFSNNDSTVTFTPTSPFSAGDVVTVYMSHDLKAADGTFLRQAGYTFMFTVVAAPSAGTFCHRTTFSGRSIPTLHTNIYGGLACDLNQDHIPDLTLVNEISGDLRTFFSDGVGTFQPMLAPASILIGSSPNEPSDFNGDGLVDIVVSSYQTNQIAIRMGNGNGTWAAPTIFNTGAYPLGDAVLDFDGDGDIDIAVAIRNTDQISLYTNNGLGVFSGPVNIPSGGDGPYGLATADMNNDGILDLVVGHNISETCVILRGNGNGTFTQVSSINIGGTNRVVTIADVNNDGFMDVGSGNGGTATATILKGNGNGTLQPATAYPTIGTTAGNDFVDIDGDGDLDWMVTSFGATKWFLYRNNGAGVFTLLREFQATSNPACSLSADFDNDGDMDLILLDEIADLIMVMINTPGSCYGNCDCSNGPPALTANDFQCFLDKFVAKDPTADCDHVGGLTGNDFQCFLSAFVAGCS